MQCSFPHVTYYEDRGLVVCIRLPADVTLSQGRGRRNVPQSWQAVACNCRGGCCFRLKMQKGCPCRFQQGAGVCAVSRACRGWQGTSAHVYDPYRLLPRHSHAGTTVDTVPSCCRFPPVSRACGVWQGHPAHMARLSAGHLSSGGLMLHALLTL